MSDKDAIQTLQEIRRMNSICFAFNLDSEKQKRDKRLAAIDTAIKALQAQQGKDGQHEG